MPEYRAYVVGEDGHFTNRRAFISDNDDDATVWARQLVDGCDVELWSGARFAVRIKDEPEKINNPGTISGSPA
jgi:hypothetical protein